MEGLRDGRVLLRRLSVWAGTMRSATGALFGKEGVSTGMTRAAQNLHAQLEETDAAYDQLKKTYREVAQLSREQRSQIERLRVAEQLFEISATDPLTDGDANTALLRLLRVVTDALEAGGGALWLRLPGGDTLVVQAVDGRGAAALKETTVPHIAETSPGELRAMCEAHLLTAAPPALLHAYDWQRAGHPSEGEEPISEPTVGGAHPVAAALLREAVDGDGMVGAVLGAIGIYEPRGAARFSPSDLDRLQSLAAPLAAALTNLEQRRRAGRRLREISLLYDLSRLFQTASDMEQVYKAVVAQAQQLIPCENCTLFLFDANRRQLNARATRGRVVNLLDHYAFEKGHGVSGWVAGRGKPLIIPDLTREPNLLNVELLPPRIRSFIAMPLKVRNEVIGILNISHSQPNAFSGEDMQLLTILAGQAAVTIERTETFHTLETLAITDGLTHVYNHRYFQMRLDDELKRCKRYHTNLTLMLLDIDHFKAINDRYGHASGDAVLRELATLLRRSVRDTEIVARYGGEEFALILPQTALDEALIAANRVRANIEAQTFQTADGQDIRLTVSIGMATAPTHGISRSELITQTDRALYAAKDAGRNRVVTATAEIAGYAVTAAPVVQAVASDVTPPTPSLGVPA